MLCILFWYAKLRMVRKYLDISMVSVFIRVIVYLEGSTSLIV